MSDNSKVTRKMLTVKMPQDMLSDFSTAARLHGMTMSSMVYQFVMRKIREEKERMPHAFPDFDWERHKSPTGAVESQIVKIIRDEGFSDANEDDLDLIRIAIAVARQMKAAQVIKSSRPSP